MKMLPTQPMFNISMEEMDMTVSEHYCCSGGCYGTDPKEATYLGTLPQYLGFAQDGQMHVYKDKTVCTELPLLSPGLRLGPLLKHMRRA